MTGDDYGRMVIIKVEIFILVDISTRMGDDGAGNVDGSGGGGSGLGYQ